METPSFGDMSLGLAAIVGVIYIAVLLIQSKKEKAAAPSSALTLEQALQIIKENSQINARLVLSVEAQSKAINDLVYAINRLIGRIEGGE